MRQRTKYLVNLGKRDRSRFGQELKLGFFSGFRGPFRLTNPIKCRTIKMAKKSLIGHSFYFLHLRSYKVRSPLDGYVAKIYVDAATIHLINDNGLQIILTVRFNAKLTSACKVIHCLVREKQKVKQGTVLFLIVHEKQISSVIVMVPGQPYLLKKVSKGPPSGNYFASLQYRNPWEKIKIRRFGEY